MHFWLSYTNFSIHIIFILFSQITRVINYCFFSKKKNTEQTLNSNEVIYTTIFLIVSILIANKISNFLKKKTHKKINISYQRKIIQGNDSKLYKIILDLYNKKAKNDTIDQYLFCIHAIFNTKARQYYV